MGGVSEGSGGRRFLPDGSSTLGAGMLREP